MKISDRIAYERKAIACLLGALLVWAQLVPDFHHLTRADFLALALAVASAFGVHGVTNTPPPAPDVLTGKDALAALRATPPDPEPAPPAPDYGVPLPQEPGGAT